VPSKCTTTSLRSTERTIRLRIRIRIRSVDRIKRAAVFHPKPRGCGPA
jgi:hypothetical protein